MPESQTRAAALPASYRERKQGLQQHLRETKDQVKRLEDVFELLGEQPKAKKCKGIEGLLAEGDEVMGNVADAQVLDAAFIAAAQAVEHYEITRYGALIAWAVEMDRRDVARILQQTLKEEKAADHKLSLLAERKANPRAEGEPVRRRRTARAAARKRTAKGKAAARRKSA